MPGPPPLAPPPPPPPLPVGSRTSLGQVARTHRDAARVTNTSSTEAVRQAPGGSLRPAAPAALRGAVQLSVGQSEILQRRAGLRRVPRPGDSSAPADPNGSPECTVQPPLKGVASSPPQPSFHSAPWCSTKAGTVGNPMPAAPEILPRRGVPVGQPRASTHHGGVLRHRASPAIHAPAPALTAVPDRPAQPGLPPPSDIPPGPVASEAGAPQAPGQAPCSGQSHSSLASGLTAGPSSGQQPEPVAHAAPSSGTSAATHAPAARPSLPAQASFPAGQAPQPAGCWAHAASQSQSALQIPAIPPGPTPTSAEPAHDADADPLVTAAIASVPAWAETGVLTASNSKQSCVPQQQQHPERPAQSDASMEAACSQRDQQSAVGGGVGAETSRLPAEGDVALRTDFNYDDPAPLTRPAKRPRLVEAIGCCLATHQAEGVSHTTVPANADSPASGFECCAPSSGAASLPATMLPVVGAPSQQQGALPSSRPSPEQGRRKRQRAQDQAAPDVPPPPGLGAWAAGAPAQYKPQLHSQRRSRRVPSGLGTASLPFQPFLNSAPALLPAASQPLNADRGQQDGAVKDRGPSIKLYDESALTGAGGTGMEAHPGQHTASTARGPSQGETKADSSAPPTQNAPAHRVAPSMPADVSLSPAADSAHIQQPADSAPPAAAGLLGGVQPTGDNSIPAGCTGSPAVQQAVRQVQAAQSALEDIKSGPSEVTAHVPGDSPPLAPSSAAAQPTADPARGPCVAVHTGSLNSQPAVRQASSPGDALEAGAGEGLPQSAAADVQMDLSRPLQPAVASTLPAAEPCLPQQANAADPGSPGLHLQTGWEDDQADEALKPVLATLVPHPTPGLQNPQDQDPCEDISMPLPPMQARAPPAVVDTSKAGLDASQQQDLLHQLLATQSELQQHGHANFELAQQLLAVQGEQQKQCSGNTELAQQLLAAQAELQQQGNANGELEQRLLAAQSEQQQQHTANAELAGQLLAAQSDMQQQHSAHAALGAQLAAVQSELQAHHNANAELAGQVLAAQREVQQQHVANAELAGKLLAAQSELRQRSGANSELAGQLQAAHQERAHLQASLLAASNATAALRATLASSQVQAQGLQEATALANHTLQEVCKRVGSQSQKPDRPSSHHSGCTSSQAQDESKEEPSGPPAQTEAAPQGDSSKPDSGPMPSAFQRRSPASQAQTNPAPVGPSFKALVDSLPMLEMPKFMQPQSTTAQTDSASAGTINPHVSRSLTNPQPVPCQSLAPAAPESMHGATLNGTKSPASADAAAANAHLAADTHRHSTQAKLPAVPDDVPTNTSAAARSMQQASTRPASKQTDTLVSSRPAPGTGAPAAELSPSSTPEQAIEASPPQPNPHDGTPAESAQASALADLVSPAPQSASAFPTSPDEAPSPPPEQPDTSAQPASADSDRGAHRGSLRDKKAPRGKVIRPAAEVALPAAPEEAAEPAAPATALHEVQAPSQAEADGSASLEADGQALERPATSSSMPGRIMRTRQKGQPSGKSAVPDSRRAAASTAAATVADKAASGANPKHINKKGQRQPSAPQQAVQQENSPPSPKPALRAAPKRKAVGLVEQDNGSCRQKRSMREANASDRPADKQGKSTMAPTRQLPGRKAAKRA